MELPFKYIILKIVKMLHDRNMEPIINKNKLIGVLKEIISKSHFTREEKIKLINNFDYEYELDDIVNRYYEYFNEKYDNIQFDTLYIDELDDLINEQIEESDKLTIETIEFIFEHNTKILEIMGVNLKKELYNILLDLDKEIEKCYNELSDLDNYIGLTEVNIEKLTDKIKKLIFKRMILIININNLLSYVEYNDIVKYSASVSEQNDEYDDLNFLLDDDYYNETTIMSDAFKKSIFTCNELYYSTLKSRLTIQNDNENKNLKYSVLKFYLVFLELLEGEILKENELSSELIVVKYRLIQVIDTTYDTLIFLNKNILTAVDFVEDYSFVEYDIKYFVNELLMYDDDKYKNKDYDTKNITVYIDNMIKSLFIKAYYNLTGDKSVIDMIEKNSLYKINNISANFLKDVVEEPKKRKRDI